MPYGWRIGTSIKQGAPGEVVMCAVAKRESLKVSKYPKLDQRFKQDSDATIASVYEASYRLYGDYAATTAHS